MAKIILETNNTFSIGPNASDSTVYGAAGTEKVILAAGSYASIDQNVERTELSGASSSYTYAIAGNKIIVSSGSKAVATIIGGNGNKTIAFSDGSATLALTGLNKATLGGQVISTTASALAGMTLNVAEKSASSPAVAVLVASTYTITSSTSSVTEGNMMTFTVTRNLATNNPGAPTTNNPGIPATNNPDAPVINIPATNNPGIPATNNPDAPVGNNPGAPVGNNPGAPVTNNPVVLVGINLDAPVINIPVPVTAQTLTYLISGTEITSDLVPAATDADFSGILGKVTIPAGATSATFTVTPVNDGVVEGLESFKVYLLDSNFDKVATSSSIVINDAPATSNPIVLTGTSADDILVGSLGNDTIYGVGGSDNINAGAGNDTIILTNSNVIIDGTIAGGEGVDKLVLTIQRDMDKRISDAEFTNISAIEILQLTGRNTVNLGTNALNAGIKQVNIDNHKTWITTSYDINIDATAISEDNTLNMGARILSLSGNGNVTATLGNTFYGLVSYLFTGNLKITGGLGITELSGGSGDDNLNANASISAVTISGGDGSDTMTGGSAADTFVFSSIASTIGSNLDVITNYAGDVDMLQFSLPSTYLAGSLTLPNINNSAPISGSSVQVNNGGLLTFHSSDNTYDKKILAVEDDTGLDFPNQVALFTSGSDSYVYYSGALIGNSDDQIVKLSNLSGTGLKLDLTGKVVTVSKSPIAPTITITDDKLGVANGPILYTFTLSDASNNFTLDDIVVTGGTKAASLTAVSSTVYTLSVTPTANSTVPVTVNVAAAKFTDLAGNGNLPTAINTQDVDTVAPTIKIEDNQAGVLKNGDVVYTFTLSEASNTFTLDDITITGGTKAASLTTVSSTVYTLSVTPNANSDTSITVDIAAGKFSDAVGNGNVAATQSVQEVNTKPINGTAIDGYLTGSDVFADTNGDGIWNAGEAKATTDADGKFTLTSSNGAIVVSGGTDKTTGQAFKGVLKAPEGATAVTPLTTVQQGFVESGQTLAQAQASVAKAFGFSNTINLATYDPIAALTNASAVDKAQATNLLASAAKIANFLVTAGETLKGAGGDKVTTANAGSALLKSLVSSIKSDSDGVIDLADKTLLKAVINDSAKEVTKTVTGATSNFEAKITTLADTFANVMKDATDNITAAVTAGGSSDALLTSMGNVAKFTQTGVAAKLQDVAKMLDPNSAVEIILPVPPVEIKLPVPPIDPLPIVTPQPVMPIASTGGVSTTVSPVSVSTLTIKVLGSSDASQGNVVFNFTTGTYQYDIRGFSSGDSLNFPSNAAPTIRNGNGTDGVIDIQWADNGNVISVHLTGLTTEQDNAIFNASSFNNIFGNGSIGSAGLIFTLT